MPRRAAAASAGQQHRSLAGKPAEAAHDSQQRRPKAGLYFDDPFGSWGDNNLSLLSAQASRSVELGTPRKDSAAVASTPRVGDSGYGGDHQPPDASGRTLQEQQQASPCDSDGLTANSGDDASPEPVASGTTAGPPGEPSGNSLAPESQRGRKGKRQKKGGMYADLIGREVDVPASIFDIQVPDLFYRAVVKKKDNGHPRAVVIRFPEDGSTFWLPVDEVRGFIADMEARRGLGHKSLAGERCAAYAAEVLISLSGAAGSDGTRHSGGSSAAAEPQKAGRQHAGGGEAESVMISPARKRARL